MASQASSNHSTLQSFTDYDAPLEKCCDDTRVIETEHGEIVCTNCGLVHEEKIKKSESRSAYTKEEMDKRYTSAPLVPGVFPRIQIPKHGKGAVKDLLMWSRLARLNNQRIDGLHQIYFNKVRADCKDLNLSWCISETAVKIFSECMKSGNLRGRCVIGMSNSCIYYACVVNKFPLSIKIFRNDADARARMQISLRFAKEAANALYGNGVKNTVKTPADQKLERAARKSEYIVKFCELIEKLANDAGMDDMPCKNAAKEIYSKIAAEKEGIMFSGKSPITIIAALLFIAAKVTNALFTAKNNGIKYATQRAVANCLNITEVSLRSRAKEIAIAATQIRKRTGKPVHPVIDEYAMKYDAKEKTVISTARAEREQNRRRSWRS